MSLLDRIINRRRVAPQTLPSATPPPEGTLAERLMQRGASRRKDHTTETERVLGLDVEHLEEVDLTSSLRTPSGQMKLRPLQSQALEAIRRNNGGFFPIGVGHGKSLIALLSGTVLGCELVVVLTPASTVGTLRKTYAETRMHFRMRKVRILSYASLSQPSGTKLLEDLTKSYGDHQVALVCDEAHRVKRLESARTKRLLRFLQAHPKVRFIALSGTMTSRSLGDFAHLAELALREKSPVPRDSHHLRAWKECLDVNGRPGVSEWSMFSPVWKAAFPDLDLTSVRGAERQALAREAFQKRLRSAPGVVASTEGSLGCSLQIRLVDLETPLLVADHLQNLVDNGEDPAGEIAADEITVWRMGRQLSQGFYLVWDWPNGIVDEEWLDARREWNRNVRSALLNHSAEGYDSPFLVANRVQRDIDAGVRLRVLHRAWLAWKEQKHKDPPPTKPVWVDSFIVDHSITWLNSQKEPSILWFENKAIGDALEERGVRVYRAGEEPPTEGHNCAMSIQAHGIGKNLQGWANQLVICPPTGGQVWEQLLGRTHRQGQTADEVQCLIYQHTAPFELALVKARDDARYIQDSSGNRQKLLFADWTDA